MAKVKPPTLRERVESLERIIENMATQHVTFVGSKGEELHPDWCPLCRLEKAEQIGSPKAIAEWVETTVIPMMAAKNNIPEKALAKGMVHIGMSCGDLLKAIRESEVLL